MTRPRLYSCWFEQPAGLWPPAWYARHARVLAHSARVNARGWEVDVRKLATPPPRPAAIGGSGASAFASNTYKLESWCDVVGSAPDGELLLLIDVDTMVLRALDPAWDQSFDVALTTKGPGARVPINAGVVFVRVGAPARAFMAAWALWNRRLLADADLHRRYRAVYAGMNQAALGALLEHDGGRLASVGSLPCSEWNCETDTWETFDPARPPRIVHVKAAMRRGVMGSRGLADLVTPARRAIAEAWKELEREAIAREEVSA